LIEFAASLREALRETLLRVLSDLDCLPRLHLSLLGPLLDCVCLSYYDAGLLNLGRANAARLLKVGLFVKHARWIIEGTIDNAYK